MHFISFREPKHNYFIFEIFLFTVARKETAREKQLKEEEKILESVAEKKGVCQAK